MTTSDRLEVLVWIEVGVKDDDLGSADARGHFQKLTCIGCRQIDAHASCPRSEKKNKVVGPWRIERVHVLLPLRLLHIAVQPEVLDAFTNEEVLDCVCQLIQTGSAALNGTAELDTMAHFCPRQA